MSGCYLFFLQNTDSLLFFVSFVGIVPFFVMFFFFFFARRTFSLSHFLTFSISHFLTFFSLSHFLNFSLSLSHFSPRHRFRFLKKLLLVHGRWSSRRISFVINYLFYKNILCVIPAFIYGFYNIMSGRLLFNVWMSQTFNLVTALPVIVYGIYGTFFFPFPDCFFFFFFFFWLFCFFCLPG